MILCRKGRQAGITFRVLALLQCRGQIIIDKILRQRKRKVFHRRRPQRGGQVGLRLPETVFRRSGSLLVCIFIPTIIEPIKSIFTIFSKLSNDLDNAKNVSSLFDIL